MERFETPDSHQEIELEVANWIEKWRDGIDLEAKAPKTFDVSLKDFYTRQEMLELTAGKTAEETAEMTSKNNEAIMQNNAAIDQFNKHILDVAEMTPEAVEELYRNPQTSSSDKSVIACIEAIKVARGSETNPFYYAPDEIRLWWNVEHAIEAFDGLKVVDAQERLKQDDAYFKILTKQERETVSEGSLEDIASAALETFAISPGYGPELITEYERYLRDIALDCTRRHVVKEDGADKIVSGVDLEEFQDRVMDSQSWAVFEQEEKSKKYTDAEFRDLQKRVAIEDADTKTGRHFENDIERRTYRVEMINGEEKSVWDFKNDKARDKFWDTYYKRVRQNSRETFIYERKLATAEMRPWADKIDLDQVEEINQNNLLSYEEKCAKIAAHIQEAFEVRNPGEDGESRPINVAWFRRKDSRLLEAARKLLKIPKTDDDLPEAEWSCAGYYSRKRVFLPKPKPSKKRLTNSEIGTIAHEMWHAKQHDMIEDKTNAGTMSVDDLKRRIYAKNDLAYCSPGSDLSLFGYTGYEMQAMEREAFAIGDEVDLRMERRKSRRRGRALLDFMASGRSNGRAAEGKA